MQAESIVSPVARVAAGCAVLWGRGGELNVDGGAAQMTLSGF